VPRDGGGEAGARDAFGACGGAVQALATAANIAPRY